MPDKPNNPFQFWEELKRRRVIRVITVYAAAAFVLLELVDIISEPFGLPDWTLKLVTVLLVIGFIISVILSWIYDVTPEGIEKTKTSKEVASIEAQPASKGWRIATFISILIIIAFVVFYIIGNKKSTDISNLEKSIAVLPFENMSDDDKFSWVGDAITDEIIMQLYKINEFEVRSRTSIMQYKNTVKTSPEIGAELLVNYLLEGSAQRYGDQVRIRIQLIQASSDEHIWADIFEGEWKDILNIQINVAKQVAYELKTALSPEEILKIEKKPTENLEAYNYYLRGNEYYWKSYELQDYEMSLKMYKKATELDPNFAIAHARTAQAYLNLYWSFHDQNKNQLIKSKQALDIAFRIEPDLNEAFIAFGMYYYIGFYNYSQALEQLNIALNQSPKNSECIFLIAAVNRRAGNWGKALENFTRALKLDPRSSYIAFNTGETYELLRDYSEALRFYDITIMLRPDWNVPYRQKAHMHFKWNGNTQKSRIIMQEAYAMVTSPAEKKQLNYEMISMEVYDGNYEDALKYLLLIKGRKLSGPGLLYPPAYVFCNAPWTNG